MRHGDTDTGDADMNNNGVFFVIKPSDTKYLIIENLSIHMTNMFCDIKLSS